MTEKTPDPVIGETRLLQLHGATRLGLDIAKRQGEPVAVVGPNAATCPRCRSDNGHPCRDHKGRQQDHPHMERIMAMNKRIAELQKEAGDK